ncbi:MAG: DsbC family protein [Burkholderiaceae bacterium]|nr:DsbC family protein [Rhodoferax sp.]MCB2007076.1 DsbC family protein [Rhodoferax sp.]MCP5262963.1 DsbC family protein [Rhodoferax sp.]MCW5630435.1 DsbC family protein [Rhodoferax sp.]
MNFLKSLATVVVLAVTLPALAQEAVIRKNLGERIPQLQKIDEVSKSPMPGLWEIRINGTDIFYTDAEGNYLIQGSLIDTRARRNLTEERVEKLSAIAFDELPLKDAFTIVRGNGKRKLAVFEDPNCGYCKRFERDLQKVDNITVHMFLYPILGPDSVDKSKRIWCAKEPAKAWLDLMVRDRSLPVADGPGCDTAAITRNVELGRKHKISGTPTLIFADGQRVPGAINALQVEKFLADAK